MPEKYKVYKCPECGSTSIGEMTSPKYPDQLRYYCLTCEWSGCLIDLHLNVSDLEEETLP